ncbi:MAG TPA: DNA-binding protein [Geobacter sp.]|nr:DNA-binding protein [Geobacter sp.]
MKRLAMRLSLLTAIAVPFAAQHAYSASETPPGSASKPTPKEIALSGKVLETMDGGGYTYIFMKNGNEKVWVAVPVMKVAVGQELTLIPGFEMKNFTSKALNRKFDKVIFSAGVINATTVQLSPAAIKMAHQGVPGAQAAPKGKAEPVAKKASPTPLSIERIKKAKGPNAFTVAQIYAKSKQLEKKPVVVRGKVVKVSPRILKRNWVHIQDGTGTEKKKNNNLIITTKDLPNIGDVVTARGTLYNNMDFGSGYRYGVLIEGARFK